LKYSLSVFNELDETSIENLFCWLVRYKDEVKLQKLVWWLELCLLLVVPFPCHI